MAITVIKAMFTISAPLKARFTVNTFECTLVNPQVN